MENLVLSSFYALVKADVETIVSSMPFVSEAMNLALDALLALAED